MPKIIDVPGHGQVEFPDGMSDEQIVAAIQKNSAPQQSRPAAQPQIDPSEGRLPFSPFGIDTGMMMPQGVSRFMAGAGKAFTDIGRGTGQLAREGIEAVSQKKLADALRLPTRKDIDEANKIDKPLMDTGAGMAGNVVGNIAGYAPLALIPGAASVGGGAALGAATGAAQPVGTNDSRLGNMALSGAFGAAVPATISTAKALRAGLVDPFTAAGRTKIAGNVINKVVNDPSAVSSRLSQAAGRTPGFMPTVGQSAGEDGAAALERTMRGIDPAGFSGVDQGQRSALAQALRNIAGTPEERAALVQAREAAVKPLYTQAKSAVVEGDDAFDALMARPSMGSAKGEASKLALEKGRKFTLAQGAQEQNVPTGLLDAQGSPIMNVIPAQPAKYSGQALHDLKIGLDSAIGSPIPGAQGMQGAQRDAAIGTKEKYLEWLESKIPPYATAKEAYATMSKPINQMDIGGEMYNRFVPALADNAAEPFRATSQSFAKALRDADQVARKVTGMKSVKMSNIMTPEQMATFEGVAQDAATKAAAETAGRGVGSDTVQKISMSNIASEAGIPTWMSNVASVPGGWAKRAGDLLYGSSDEAIRARLSELLRNPQEAAKAMRAAGATPSQIADALKLSAQGAALSIPASFNALE